MNKKSFSLIELVIIVLVIGIMAAVVISSLHIPSELRLEAAKNKIMHDIGYAQNLSLTQQKQYGVRFRPGQNRYWLYDVAAGHWVRIKDPITGDQYEIDFDDDSRFQGIGIKITQAWMDGRRLYFDLQGRPYVRNGILTSQARIQLRDSVSGKQVDIFIDPNTGLVSTVEEILIP